MRVHFSSSQIEESRYDGSGFFLKDCTNPKFTYIEITFDNFSVEEHESLYKYLQTAPGVTWNKNHMINTSKAPVLKTYETDTLIQFLKDGGFDDVVVKIEDSVKQSIAEIRSNESKKMP